jgi:hypothetical protein
VTLYSLDGTPRVSARRALSLEQVEAFAGGAGAALLIELEALVRHVGRETQGLPITRRTVYVVYEESVEWEPPPTRAA